MVKKDIVFQLQVTKKQTFLSKVSEKTKSRGGGEGASPFVWEAVREDGKKNILFQLQVTKIQGFSRTLFVTNTIFTWGGGGWSLCFGGHEGRW